MSSPELPMLAALRRRLANDPDTELRIAEERQRLITLHRLDDVMRSEAPV